MSRNPPPSKITTDEQKLLAVNNNKTTEIRIKNTIGQVIVGILEQNETKPSASLVSSTRGARIGLICHGLFGHKNYCYQEQLAKSLPFDNFRFDFRGSGDSEGEALFESLQEDFDDIETVFNYLVKEYGYRPFTIIAHSKAAATVLSYAATRNRTLPHIVNVSGMYYLSDYLKMLPKQLHDALETRGTYDWEMKSANKTLKIRTTTEHVKRFVNSPVHLVATMPESTSVLTIHGTADEQISLENAVKYANLIPNHTLKFIIGATHTYKDHTKEIVAEICEYFSTTSLTQRFFQRNRWLDGGVVPRVINVEGFLNFCDFGGWRCTDVNGDGANIDGVSEMFVRERYMFKCGELTKITQEGIKALHRLNIKKIFDIRSSVSSELETQDIKNIDGIVQTTVFVETEYTSDELFEPWNTWNLQEIALGFLQALKEGAEAYAKIFRHVLENPYTPFVIHCSVGRDRTGLFVMLALKLAGVSDEVVAREYEMTMAGKFDEHGKLENSTVSKSESPQTASYESMIQTLVEFHKTYHSAENFLVNECGFSVVQVKRIRSNLVHMYLVVSDIQAYNAIANSGIGLKKSVYRMKLLKILVQPIQQSPPDLRCNEHGQIYET
ncbi:8642_t:CDS:10 [Ambispora leptoticha]|uniref:8642_t:CDS:1 n=1 Tax=Ambispora leptoticha TaxID=144679 RepID=A0A9N9EEQ1_9GLOM|nr:8642_t:CDS:10 [Ambispora leptoticha]